MKRILWSARLRSGIGGHAGGGFVEDGRGNKFVEGIFEVPEGTPPDQIEAMVAERAAKVVNSDWRDYAEYLEEQDMLGNEFDPDNPPMHYILA